MSYFDELPSLEDERRTYGTWSEVIQPPTGDPLDQGAEMGGFLNWGDPSQPLDSYTYGLVDLHDDWETCQLWEQLHMWRRTRRSHYRKRMNNFASFYLASPGFAQMTIDESFGNDHTMGWGLIDYYLLTGDEVARTRFNELIDGLVAKIDLEPGTFGWPTGLGPSPGGTGPGGGNSNLAHWGHRGFGRFLLLSSYASRFPSLSTSKVVWMRDTLADGWAFSTGPYLKVYEQGVDKGSMYFGLGLTNSWDESDPDPVRGGFFPEDTWTVNNDRILQSFECLWLFEGMWQYLKAVGLNGTPQAIVFQTRLVEMANWAMNYALEPTAQLSPTGIGFLSCTFDGSGDIDSFLPFYSGGPASPSFNPSYTHAWCNLLVMAYKLTGDQDYYDRAKLHFLRANGGINGSPYTTRNQLIHHLMNTRYDSGDGDRVFDWNQSELMPAYMLFQNGGAPVLDL